MFYVLVQRVKGQEHQGKYNNNNNNVIFSSKVHNIIYLLTTCIIFHENFLILEICQTRQV